MKKTYPVAVAVVLVVFAGLSAAAQASSTFNATPTLSFYSGGAGAHADWQYDANDSPNNDVNHQDIRIVTTTAATGYAGVLVHHVAGWPTADYPNSSFEVKTDGVAPSGVNSLGSPRLVVQFSDGGNGQLRPLMNNPMWQKVQDPNWDNNGGTCGSQFQKNWQDIQNCHPGTTITDVYIATDPYGFTYYIDNLNTAGKNFSQAADNGGG